VSARKQVSDLWWKNAVVYCLDVQTFYDSDGDGCGDLRGLTERIDHLAGLGVTCLWLMPFFPSPERDDGYDIVDFYAVDPRLGTLGDLVELVRTARDRGIRVIIDLVVNHTSTRHPWFQRAREGRDSPYHDWYVWRDEEPEDPGEVVFPGEETSTWAYDEKCGRWYLHSFYTEQPDLDVANPEVRDEIVQIAGFWLQQGLSGFRIDAVPFLIQAETPDPHDLLRDLRSYLTRRDGEVALLGEVNVPPDEQRRFFGDEDGDELTMMFDFVANQAMYLAFARERAQPLADALRARPELPPDAQYATFARNHDELTLDKLSDEEREEVFAAFGPDEEVQVYGRGLRLRLPSILGGDERRLRMAYSLVFSLPGTPTLFYGEEIGMRENLAIDGRLAVRTPMRWSGERNAGFSTVQDAGSLCRPMLDDDVDVASQRRDPDSFLNWFERLVRRYKECPELGWGAWRVLDAGDDAVFAHRCDWDDRCVVAVHNLAGRAAQVRLDVDGEALVDLFGPGELDARATAELELEPYGHRWYRLRRAGQRVAL
jgi:trehalose synthase